MKSFCNAFVVTFLLLQGLTNLAKAMLLTSPSEILQEEVEERAHILSLEMNSREWNSRTDITSAEQHTERGRNIFSKSLSKQRLR